MIFNLPNKKAVILRNGKKLQSKSDDGTLTNLNDNAVWNFVEIEGEWSQVHWDASKQRLARRMPRSGNNDWRHQVYNFDTNVWDDLLLVPASDLAAFNINRATSQTEYEVERALTSAIPQDPHGKDLDPAIWSNKRNRMLDTIETPVVLTAQQKQEILSGTDYAIFGPELAARLNKSKLSKEQFSALFEDSMGSIALAIDAIKMRADSPQHASDILKKLASPGLTKLELKILSEKTKASAEKAEKLANQALENAHGNEEDEAYKQHHEAHERYVELQKQVNNVGAILFQEKLTSGKDIIQQQLGGGNYSKKIAAEVVDLTRCALSQTATQLLIPQPAVVHSAPAATPSAPAVEQRIVPPGGPSITIRATDISPAVIPTTVEVKPSSSAVPTPTPASAVEPTTPSNQVNPNSETKRSEVSAIQTPSPAPKPSQSNPTARANAYNDAVQIRKSNAKLPENVAFIVALCNSMATFFMESLARKQGISPAAAIQTATHTFEFAANGIQGIMHHQTMQMNLPGMRIEYHVIAAYAEVASHNDAFFAPHPEALEVREQKKHDVQAAMDKTFHPSPEQAIWSLDEDDAPKFRR